MTLMGRGRQARRELTSPLNLRHHLLLAGDTIEPLLTSRRAYISGNIDEGDMSTIHTGDAVSPNNVPRELLPSKPSRTTASFNQ